MRRSWTAVALVCAALAGCKSETPAVTASVALTCSTDAECGGFRCDREQRRCVCTGDDSCPAGKFCNAFTGACVDTVPGCTTDASCGAGNYCDRALRTCKTVAPFCGACKTDGQCGEGSKCAAHPSFPNAGTFCVPLCTGGACANGLTCLSSPANDKVCYPGTGACGQSNACIPDSLKLCAIDADCGDANQTCDATLKACVARVRTCPSGDSCDPQSRLCAHACGSDSDCVQIEGGVGYQCRANACFRLALCTADSECTSGSICQPNADGSKSCKAGCVSASDCPLGQGCNKTDPAHPRCAAGCTQNQDCPLNTICDPGTSTCAGTTASCTTQTCQDTAACPIGATCAGNCCVPRDLGQQCGATGCPACSVPNGTVNPGGCPVSCNVSCFPMNLGTCNVQADCFNRGLPASVVCNGAVHQCQVEGALKPCSGAADCPMKGFRCTPLSSFGCNSTGGVCYPYEQAAQLACGVGHP